jgi:hypothetical protein
MEAILRWALLALFVCLVGWLVVHSLTYLSGADMEAI